MRRQFIFILTILPIIIGISSMAFGADEQGSLPIKALTAPQTLSLENALEPGNSIWSQAELQKIQLNRTPPIYANGPMDDGKRPQAGVQLVRLSDDTVVVRMEWTDPSVNRFHSGKSHPNGGEQHIYKTHTENTSAFGDAACVMVPNQRGTHGQYPTMMMGDMNSPTSLFYWQAGRGFSVLKAHGRETTAATPQTQQARMSREGEKWVIIQAIPNLISNTPICFAIWNGAKDHRDGLKYFSLWYEVQ